MSKFDLFKNYFASWSNTFKQKLNEDKSTKEEIFIINLKIFENIVGSHSTNDNSKYNAELLLRDKNSSFYMLDPNKKFIVIDRNCWGILENLYPNEIKIAINAYYNNKKCFFEINNLLYFYYLENNEIKEAYFQFDQDNIELRSKIKSILKESLNINVFFKKFGVRYKDQLILYEKKLIKVKIKEPIFNFKQIKKISNDKHSNNILNNNNEFKKIKSNYSCKDVLEYGSFSVLKNDEEEEHYKLYKLYECIFYYYCFTKKFQKTIN